MKLARDVMTREVLRATPEASLFDIAKLMIEGDCGEIPVVAEADRDQLVGVITDRDIVCRSLGVGKNPASLRAIDCMTKNVVTGDADMTVNDCIDIMEENQIRRLPIVDESGKLCGIISQADVVREYTDIETDYFLEAISRPTEHPSRLSA